MSTTTDREVLLTQRAVKACEEFERIDDPEAYALGTFTATAALLCMRIASLQITAGDDTPAGKLLHAKHLESATLQMDEALDLLNGWHAAQERLAAKRRAENSLATVAWPTVGGDAS